jgi:hypothetical protein
MATTHRSGQTLQPGQGSFSASYLRAENLEDPHEESVQLICVDARVGATRGFDVGFGHSLDVSEVNENRFSTVWGDMRWQLSNYENTVGKPTFSMGFMKGYVYHEDVKIHITTFPFWLSIPASDYVTAYCLYRHELISDCFIPTSLMGPRRMLVLGAEFALNPPSSDRWTPKVGLSIGTYNALAGGDGDPGLTINVGFTFDSPYR